MAYLQELDVQHRANAAVRREGDWSLAPFLRAAFPFLAPALSRELVATGIISFHDGRWFLDFADAQASIPGHHEGFWACPEDREKPDRGCRN